MKLFTKKIFKKLIKKNKSKPKKEEKKMVKKIKEIKEAKKVEKIVETENVKVSMPTGQINEVVKIEMTPIKLETNEAVKFKDLKEDERICPACGSIMKITSHGAMSTSYKCTNTQCNKGWTF